jgi:phenylacetate-CoA ligase
MTGIQYYWKSLDWDQFMADYPPPPVFESTTGRLSDDELRHLQEERFLARVGDAWKTDFYRRRWTERGLEPGDIGALEDIEAIPTFTSDDLKKAVAQAPPFGSHHPIGRAELGQVPMRIQTSGGTTGLPRTTLFDPVAWEVQGVQFARALWAQGGRPGHVFQIPFTAALGNAAWAATVGIFHWLGGVPANSGSGLVTPAKRQMEFARLWGTNAFVTFGGGEYLIKLKEAADELGIDVREDVPLKYLHAYLGVDSNNTLRNLLQELWGVPVYDNYGTHEIGIASFECAHQNGMHVNEDTVIFQVHDVDTGSALSSGEPGNLVATSLHRGMPPIIRYNLRDRLAQFDRTTCECGLRTVKLSGFLGRTDEMIKLRGQNVYPRACQEVVLEDDRTTGEFLVVVTNTPGRDFSEDMTIRIERRTASVSAGALRDDMVQVLHDTLGVRVEVEIAEAGELARFTSLGGEGKVKRLLDLRKYASPGLSQEDDHDA